MIISKNKAKEICSNWHGGQWSALYQFASSGIYVGADSLKYLKEVKTCLEPEYNLYPSELTKKDSRELNSLKNFFLYKAKEMGLIIVFKKHPVYGYQVPFIETNLYKVNIEPVYLLI